MNRNFFVRRTLMTMAITLLTVAWVFMWQGIKTKEWDDFRILGSIFLFIALYSAADFIISYKIQFNFLAQKVTLLIVFFGLFEIFGRTFDWGMPSNFFVRIQQFLLIVAPMYVIWYLIDLRNARKIAADINKQIQVRNKKQEMNKD